MTHDNVYTKPLSAKDNPPEDPFDPVSRLPTLGDKAYDDYCEARKVYGKWFDQWEESNAKDCS